LCRVSEAQKDRLIESALEDVPQGLNNTYKRILHQIDTQIPYMKALAFNSFAWVLCAKRPLRTGELQDALVTEEPLKSRQDLELDSVDVILKACANLLVEEHGIIRPIHYSVQEFLTNPPFGALQGSCLEKIQVPAFVRQKLALTCVFYFQLEVLHEGPCQRYYDLYFRLFKNPLLWYAARFFDYHIRDLQDIPADVFQALETFLHQSALVLAAVLQIRKVQNPEDYRDITRNFDKVSYHVDASTILYSTHLYDIALLKTQLVDSQVPKYALHNAAANGSLQAVARLVEVGCSIDEKDENHRPPLLFAALGGYGLVVKRLLQEGAEINTHDGYYGNALQAASVNGHEAVVRLLLQDGADVNAQGGHYGNALQAASVNGHEAVVRLLLQDGADVNAQGGYFGNALQAASLNGYEAVVRLLLQEGADVNAQGGDFGNALQAASVDGHEAVVRLLLQEGADVNAQGGDFGNVLKAALANGHEVIVKLLEKAAL
jgi:ankyrin repeat protein